MKTQVSQSSPKRGFTVVEMLTVIGIISLLIALVTPSLLDVVRSTRLGSTGDALVNRISLAQQSAISLSSEVEMRFYRYVDSTSDRPGDDLFYAYQVVQTLPDGTQKAISDVYYLETGVVVSNQDDLSPLLTTSVQQVESANGAFLFTPPGSATGDSVNYASLRFYPDGSMRFLSAAVNPTDEAAEVAQAYTIPEFNRSYIMLVESRFALDSQVPPNYYCIQIDSYTGKTRVYRPGI